MLAVWGIVIAILVVAGMAASVPFVLELKHADEVLPRGYESSMALAVFFALIAFGAGIVFAVGLSGFKTAFKRSYAFICAGLMVHGVSMLVFPGILLLAPQYFTTDLPTLLGDTPYMVGTVLVFMGLLYFGRLLDLRTWLNNRSKVAGVLFAVLVVAWFTPHLVAYNGPEWRFDLFRSVLWVECMVTIFCMVLLVKLRRTASLIYRRPLAWLVAAMTANLVAGILYLCKEYLYQAVALYDLVGLVYALTQLLFLIAGYSFNHITRAKSVPEDDTPFGVITYVASLGSYPPALDRVLNPLRSMTAMYKSGETLSAQQLGKLAAIYRDLESYLVTSEPLRNFTRDEIRQQIQNRFSPATYAHLFEAKIV